MIRNFLKIAWRNLVKNRTYSIINITGLAVGLASFILIALYVVDELSYDRYNEKADRIYRLNADIRFGGSDLLLAVSSDPMGSTLKKDYPQVEEFTRIYASGGSKQVKKGDQFINETAVFHADSTFFSVFTLPALYGDTRTALNEPNTVVITATTAKKYFGTTNAIGKVIEADGTPYKVTAVIKDIPRTSHFRADFIFTMDNVDYNFGNFLSNNHQTYIVLKKGTDYKAFEKNFDQVIVKYVLPQAKQYMQINSMEDFKKAGNKLEYSLMPVTDIHLHSNRIAELGVNGNIQYVYVFAVVALIVLLIACVNFMNLSTARSANRAREVGIRKVLGTNRGSLIRQFLFESIVTSFIASIIAVGTAILMLPYFNTLANKTLDIGGLADPRVLPFLILLPVVIGILAGSYPALYLSAFRPIAVLKGKLSGGSKKSGVRNVLVVLQFATCIFLVIGTLVVYNQLNYIQSKKLGFNKDQVLIVDGTGDLGRKARTAFKDEVVKLSGVTGGTMSSFLPVPSSRNDNTFALESVMDSKNGMNMQVWTVDEEYAKVLGLEMLQGRFFSKDFPSDSSAVVVNEGTAAWLGKGNVLGKKIYSFEGADNHSVGLTVVGVVKSFHFESLKQNIGPLMFRLGRSNGAASFKVNTANIQNLVEQVEKKWTAMAPGRPFRYRFMDESFNNMYRDEQQVGKLGFTFALLAIIIACLGLFGLATFMAEQRTKEIGIRKVLGASVQGLIRLLSVDFLKLVLISFVLAAPFAWFVMNRWLQDFAFRIDVTWWVFVVAGMLAVIIALLTVSFQAVRAALANPIKSLRTE